MRMFIFLGTAIVMFGSAGGGELLLGLFGWGGFVRHSFSWL